jgi:DNA-binding NarL/FixJ family response regulator
MGLIASPPKRRRIRTLIADKTRMGSQLLREVLRRDQSIDVIASTVGYAEALACVGTQKPDVAVISAELDDDDQKGLELCQEISRSSPGTRTVVLMDVAQSEEVAAAFRAGAKGVFFRTDPVTPLAKCIRCVHSEQIWASSQELNTIIDAFARSKKWNGNPSLLSRLTERERHVVSCIAEGLSNREISKRLKVSEHTTKNYIFHIFDKLGVSNRVELILCALVEPADSTSTKSNELTEDEAVLAKTYREAIARGVGVLPYRLGELYRDGIGVQQNRIEAYVWFSLAERECVMIRRAARHELKGVAVKMSAEHLGEARRRLFDILERKNGKRLASVPETCPVPGDLPVTASKPPDTVIDLDRPALGPQTGD